MQDPSGRWGGSLIFSTSSAGSSSATPSGQLTDRLTLDAQGLATFTGSVTLSSTATSLRVLGNTALGATAVQTLTVLATSNFTAPAMFTGLTASGPVLLNGGSGQTLTIQATSSFSAPVTIASDLTVNGFTNLTNGVALTSPVTIDKRPVSRIAFTANYTDLVAQPRAMLHPRPSQALQAQQDSRQTCQHGTVQ